MSTGTLERSPETSSVIVHGFTETRTVVANSVILTVGQEQLRFEASSTQGSGVDGADETNATITVSPPNNHDSNAFIFKVSGNRVKFGLGVNRTEREQLAQYVLTNKNQFFEAIRTKDSASITRLIAQSMLGM